MKIGSNSMTYQILYNSVTESAYVIINGCGNIKKMISCFCLFDSFEKALFRHIHQFLNFRAYLAYRMGSRCVGMISFVDESCIQAYDISFFQNMITARNAVNNFFID